LKAFALAQNDIYKHAYLVSQKTTITKNKKSSSSKQCIIIMIGTAAFVQVSKDDQASR
jgi:hypothetical protein